MIEDEAILDPETLIDACHIENQHNVADFGCGPGIFSIPMARRNVDGKVYCFDVLESALDAVNNRAQIMGINNIVTKRANLEKERGSGLEDNSVQHVVMRKILVQNNKRDALFKESYRVLSDDGKLLIVGWATDVIEGFGSMDKMSEDDVENIAKETGFQNSEKIEAGKYHYCFIFTK